LGMDGMTSEIQELIARALCINPPDDFITGTSRRVWQCYGKEAYDIIIALDAAGYVIVPRVPTEAMIEAGGLVDIRDRGSFYGDSTTLLPDEDAVAVYIAMIAADVPPLEG